jgi:hypothetical protein
MGAVATEAERLKLADSLARQTRQLLRPPGGLASRAERLTAAAVGGCVLAGAPGQALRRRALSRLDERLEDHGPGRRRPCVTQSRGRVGAVARPADPGRRPGPAVRADAGRRIGRHRPPDAGPAASDPARRSPGQFPGRGTVHRRPCRGRPRPRRDRDDQGRRSAHPRPVRSPAWRASPAPCSPSSPTPPRRRATPGGRPPAPSRWRWRSPAARIVW